jgi:hypothetical protein
MKIHRQFVRAAVVLALGLGVSSAALADRMDSRFGHNRSYPERGFVSRQLPRGSSSISFGRDRYWYSGGVWYRPNGGNYTVVAPPLGIRVSVLPPFYSTLWFGGIPYYYANDTYYMWNSQRSYYEVVAPPPQAVGMQEAPAPPPAPPSDQLFMYPKNGQSQDQQSKDKFECHTWALGQTGFDPTASGGNVPPSQYGEKSSAYYRALGACMGGRGYSVQ